ncbi:MAG: MoaD/ThiS family protein [Clostridiales Family XIII bacterium]|jgi:molybdopterin converting factor small subunit|nr:MoaD/ThiS family protein [Clostridiales Family XIII bacterium]
MKIYLEDLIAHTKGERELADGSDIAALLSVLRYENYDLYHTVNGKHQRFDFVLSGGDRVAIIPVLNGG